MTELVREAIDSGTVVHVEVVPTAIGITGNVLIVRHRTELKVDWVLIVADTNGVVTGIATSAAGTVAGSGAEVFGP